MRWFFRLTGLFAIIAVLGTAVLAWLALSAQPLVINNHKPSHQDIARARQLLKENDPRRLPPGYRDHLLMTQADIKLALDYLLQRLQGAGADIELLQNRVELQATVALPGLPARQFINIRSVLTAPQGILNIKRIRIGELTVPPFLQEFASRQVLSLLEDNQQAQLARQLMHNTRFDIRPGELQMTYLWDPALLDSVRSTLFTQLDRQAVQAYYQHLLLQQRSGLNRYGTLVDLLVPMFGLAKARSQSGDPVVENIALLSVLGAWALGQDLRQLVPEARQRPHGFRLKLERRVDFAQHFLGSAALAAQGDSLLADAVVTFKEVNDTDHGSGFSFTDLAADRAGIRFGELAISSNENARQVQNFIAAGIEETDIIPPARDLPEYLRTAEFKRRFGEVGSDAYNSMLREIERRIDRCRIYQLQGTSIHGQRLFVR